jgi:hypothetical protein
VKFTHRRRRSTRIGWTIEELAGFDTPSVQEPKIHVAFLITFFIIHSPTVPDEWRKNPNRMVSDRIRKES